ncbi:MAG: MFS transporter [Novosphingobium sp.]|nr:MFS transporter [Novosphingobium sp.]
MRSEYRNVIVALLVAQVAAVFEVSMIFAALPTLIREFGDPVTAVWLLTIHTLVGAGAALMAGRLGDIYGRKRVMQWMVFGAVLGSTLSALTSMFALVLVGRMLQGLASATLPLSIGILRESLPSERVPVAVGFMTTAQGFGTAVGLVLGGYIIDHFDWQWLFAASAILLLIANIVVAVWIPARAGNPPKFPIDWVEGVLPLPGITAMLLGISLSKESGWLDPLVLGLVALGVAILYIWGRRSLRAQEPFIDLRLMATRNVAITNALVVCLSMGTLQIAMISSTYMQSPAWTMAGLGLSATVAGLVKLPSNVTSFVAGPFQGWMQKRSGMRIPVLVGAALATTGWLLAMSLPSTVVAMVALLCLISFGSTMLNTSIPNIIVESVPENRTSEAIGGVRVVMSMALAIGAQITALMLATNPAISPTGAELPSPFGFRLAMGWIAALTVMAGIVSLFLRLSHERKDGDAAPVTAPEPTGP